MSRNKKYIVVAGLLIALACVAYAVWYTYDRHEKIVQVEKCNDTLTNPPKPTMVTGPDGNPAPLYSLNGCVTIVVPPSLWDVLRGNIVFENVPNRMKVNPYSFTDILLGHYTFGPTDVGCEQSATTTDCSTIVLQNPPQQQTPVTTITWKSYINSELGISFLYPTTDPNGADWRIASGTFGKSFQATIELSHATIYAYATTKDFSTEKDGFPVGTEGFTSQIVHGDGSESFRAYYPISHGQDSAARAFTPDEVWVLSDGSEVPVNFGTLNPTADYPDPPAKALINLRGSEFTGIGFVMFSKDYTRQPSSEDFNAFKKIITSIQFK